MTIEHSPPRIQWLDYGRFLSALAVVLFHYKIAPRGYLGVDFFFIVSGFVIMMSVHGRSAGEFAAARVVRLYPGYIFCMTLTALVAILAGEHIGIVRWIANATMVPNLFGIQAMDGPYWSLGFEIAFYLAVWLLLLANLRNLETAVYCWIILQIPACLIHRVPFFSGYFPSFAIGCLFSFARSDGWNARRLIFLAIAMALSIHETIFREQSVLHHSAAPAVIAALGFFAVFAIFHYFDPALPMARFVGGLTYPLYLLHMYIGAVLMGLGIPVIVVIAAMILLAALVAEFVERRPNRCYRKLTRSVLDRFPELPRRPRPQEMPTA